MNKILKTSFLLLTLFLSCFIRQAQVFSKEKQSITQKRHLANTAKIEDINSYMASISTMEIIFSQVDSANSVSNGVIYIDKPKNKLSIDYTGGVNLIKIFSVGGKQFYFDKELSESSLIPTASPVAEALLGRNLNDGKLYIDEVRRTENSVVIDIFVPNKKDEGVVTIVFNTKPKIHIYSMYIIDPITLDRVFIKFENQIINQPINQSVFSI